MTRLQANELQAAKEAVEVYATAQGYSWLLDSEASLIEGLCTAVVNAVDKVRNTEE